MDEYDLNEVIGLIDVLGNQIKCALNHGPDEYRGRNHPEIEDRAVQFIVQKFGDSSNNIATDEIQIPVCESCLETLTTENGVSQWILVYCYGCNSNHWISRIHSVKHYPPVPIYWIKNCPRCMYE